MDDFPPDVSGHTDFLTGLPARLITVTGQGGSKEMRQERVVVLDKTFTYGDPPPQPGRVAFSELTVRQMGALVGMVSREAVEILARENLSIAAERDRLSARLASALREVEALRDTTDVRVVYVTPDGKEHGSKPVADAHMQREAAHRAVAS